MTLPTGSSEPRKARLVIDKTSYAEMVRSASDYMTGCSPPQRSRGDAYECVAMSVRINGDACLAISWWAPEGSDWRPQREPQKPDELHIHIVTEEAR